MLCLPPRGGSNDPTSGHHRRRRPARRSGARRRGRRLPARRRPRTRPRPPLLVARADRGGRRRPGRRRGRLRAAGQAEGLPGHQAGRRSRQLAAMRRRGRPGRRRVARGELRLVEEFADALEPSPRAGVVVGVVGGNGGAGASLLSACLALAASRRKLRTLLVDADPLGGGIDVLLGQEEAKGARWADFVSREGRVSSAALQAALPAFGELTVLAFHRGEVEAIPPGAMRSVLEAGRRGFDLVVVDLPRHVDAAAAEALSRASSTLLLVTADVRGVLAAAQVLGEIRRHTGAVGMVLRPGVLEESVVAASLDLPCAGHLADQPRLAAALNKGDLTLIDRRSVLGHFCATLLTDLMAA
ncbi:septum site-determining protein Ssd [Nonomuraea recticatena]|uniref:septum site-determining protein Ssd n=1 Tax=Nonomuraea recticatena TaxID=46178 RepID=UPI00361B7E53